MATALERVDPGGDARIICCDISEEWTSIGRAHWERAGVAHRIDLRIAPAIETLRTLPDSPTIDLAFIDADKENDGEYYERCLRLLRTGGLVMFDNTLWGGAVADPADQDQDTLALRELSAVTLAVDPDRPQGVVVSDVHD